MNKKDIKMNMFYWYKLDNGKILLKKCVDISDGTPWFELVTKYGDITGLHASVYYRKLFPLDTYPKLLFKGIFKAIFNVE